ncbi:MAG: hypothetical protein JSS66_16855 [Armatimonadetes bacterium]|nr:hypothetical protein [Armatimonadota bacterium]
MKNRKAPVFLFGVVVVALAAVTVWNASLKPMEERINSMEKDKEGVSQHAVTDEEKAQTRNDLLKALPQKSSDNNGRRGPNGKLVGVMPEEAPGASMELAKEPTILLPKYDIYKPKPNDSTTMTHWYDGASRAAKLAEENEKSRD